jgi:hypothetical protein
LEQRDQKNHSQNHQLKSTPTTTDQHPENPAHERKKPKHREKRTPGTHIYSQPKKKKKSRQATRRAQKIRGKQKPT